MIRLKLNKALVYSSGCDKIIFSYTKLTITRRNVLLKKQTYKRVVQLSSWGTKSNPNAQQSLLEPILIILRLPETFSWANLLLYSDNNHITMCRTIHKSLASVYVCVHSQSISNVPSINRNAILINLCTSKFDIRNSITLSNRFAKRLYLYNRISLRLIGIFFKTQNPMVMIFIPILAVVCDFARGPDRHTNSHTGRRWQTTDR